MFTHRYIGSQLAGNAPATCWPRRTSSAWYASSAGTPGRPGARREPSPACAAPCGFARRPAHDITTGQHWPPPRSAAPGRRARIRPQAVQVVAGAPGPATARASA